jgi:HPt (histidine-containing phosphotransfer) domain-containing protein
MMPGTPPLLNHSQIRSMISQIGVDAHSLIDRFAKDLPNEISRIRTLAKQSENVSLADELHRLKGSCATCGFMALSEMLGAFNRNDSGACKQLERCADASIKEWREVFRIHSGS